MTVSPVDLNYRSWGCGPPLIILHGIFGSAVNWHTIGGLLARYRTVYALDMRNHGGSHHSRHFGYDVLIADIKWFMNRHGIGRADILGHSLGGKVAMAFVERFTEMTDRLIVVDIAPKPYPKGHRHMLKALIDFDLKPIGSLREAVEALAPAIPSLAIRQFLVKNLVRGENGRYAWKINLEAIYRNYGELSSGPRLKYATANPALFIRGESSEFVIDEDAALIRRYFPNARIHTVSNAGHWLHIDAPEETTAAIIDFLTQD